MGRKKKKKMMITDGEDRISSLPDTLIHHILSFLLMRDVIKTCLLSKRWRNIWKSVPVLNFGFNWRDPPRGDHEFIEQSLVHYEGQKVKTLQVKSELIADVRRLESWLLFAVVHGVEELDMSLGLDLKLLRSLFECLELRVLRLSLRDCNPPSFCFPLLTELHFRYLKATELDTSACPLLEVLIVEYPSNSLKIYAPNLKLRYLKLTEHDSIHVGEYSLTLYAPNLLYIEFKGSFRRCYEFKDISSVKTVNLESWDPLSNKRKGIYRTDSMTDMIKYGIAKFLVGLLRNLSHVKSLQLCQMCIQVLAYGQTVGLEIPALSATCLELRTNLAEHVLVGIASLLRATRYIERLIINLNFSTLPEAMFLKGHDIDAIKAWESLEHALSVELALNTILIQNYPGFHCNSSTRGKARSLENFLEYCCVEIKLVEVLLKSSKMLNKMNISIMKPPSQPLKLKLLYGLTKKLLLFPRASANAAVDFS